MAACLLPVRARLRLDAPRLWLRARSHLNIALQTPSPASLEVETMPYPTTHPDSAVFEPMSEEYASVAAPGTRQFTPLSSSETLASLVLGNDLEAAESLRREMISHQIPIPHDKVYLRAALRTISERRRKGSSGERLAAFEAWLLLAPDHHEEWQSFDDIRQRIFQSMDHLNLKLVYRFGIVLASKGYYSGDAAMQVVSTLARYARPSVLEKYLRQVEVTSREYHSKNGTVPPPDLLAQAYSLSVRTVALSGKGDAVFGLISTARSQGIRITDFTLNVVARRAIDRQMAVDRIQAVYPTWLVQDNIYPVRNECRTNHTQDSGDVAALAARLRSLRVSIRSPSPPPPHALHSFITSYQALGRTRALTLLRSLAYRHSPKSASTWAFTEMLHHRSRRQPIHLLFVFLRHFHPVGVPRTTLLSFIRGTRGKLARKERVKRWVAGPCPMNEKLWPTAYHTAIVWEAIVSLSHKADKERLYALLLSLVRQSKGQDPGWNAGDAREDLEADPVRLELPPDTFDAAHFSPFVSSWARAWPAKAASVLQDMVQLGVEPSLIQWSMVARGYAQHGDPAVAMRILDRLDEMERGKVRGDGEGEGTDTDRPSDMLLGIHTNVLRGFVIAGDMQHARDVERWLVEQLGYQVGDRPATDATIGLLRRLEERLSSS